MQRKFLFGVLIILFGCVPPTDNSPSIDYIENEIMEDCDPCELLLNFASTNYQNSDWRSAVDNYSQLLECNCGGLDPKNTFKYMAYSYQQLNMFDSAGYIFDQGLKFTPNDTELLKMAGENAGKNTKIDDQIYYFDKILMIEENNIEVLELLNDVYSEQEMYEEQIDLINIWLKYDSGNKKANSEKKVAFQELGRDVSDVDKERWESDESNIQYGIDYINALKNDDNNKKIIEVSNELLIYDKFNLQVLLIKAESLQNLYREEEALDTYFKIVKASPTDYNVSLEISKILMNKEQYEDALMWADKAINIRGTRGEAFYQRAEIYFSVAESCSKDPIQFWDKVVYEISWEDYKIAVDKGYKQAKSRRDFLQENYITTSSDWFMRPEGENIVSPKGDCYHWIEKEIKRK